MVMVSLGQSVAAAPPPLEPAEGLGVLGVELLPLLQPVSSMVMDIARARAQVKNFFIFISPFNKYLVGWAEPQGR